MTGTDPTRAPVAADDGDPETQLPPPRIGVPGESRTVLLHWILTLAGFAAMIWIGWLFSR